MTEAVATRFRLLASVVSVLLLLLILGGAWFYFQLRGSLPQLDGVVSVPGLSAPVRIARDGLGVPTLHGATQEDVARAMGFLHAQERFFQMDLMRRRAAGELAELFGRPALPIDRATRPHRFRQLAAKVLVGLPPSDRALIDSFTAGANAGLLALHHQPFEYLALRVDPEPWRAEDSLLIVYAMTLDLQDASNNYERSLASVRDGYGVEVANFFAPLLTPDDAALDGSTAPLPPIPGPALLNIRNRPVSRAGGAAPTGEPGPAAPAFADALFFPAPVDSALLAGSNSFALSGRHTASGAAILANDPHLNLGLPNIWYRAVLEWRDAEERDVRVVGATLPGLPFVVLGSNGHIAWGLTDAYADTNDLVAVELNAVSRNLYKVPDHEEFAEIETHRDLIKVKGEPSQTVETRWTIWGPVIGSDARGRPLAHHWTAYDPAATDLQFIQLQTAKTMADAMGVAHRSGIPAHSFIVVDSAGSIGWTIAGRFPKRVGFDGRLPVTWSYGDRRWDGFVTGTEVPAIANPASGRLWSANNRLVGGPALARLGDGGYSTPPRAAQIRDALAKMEQATSADLLELQRDDHALFLARWQQLLLSTLSPSAIAAKSSRAELRRAVEKWEGRASVESVSYRLVRAFRSEVVRLMLDPVFRECTQVTPGFTWQRFNYEPAVWKILQEKPEHLLESRFATWDDLLLAAADAVPEQLHAAGVELSAATWGARNRADIRHPFGRILPDWLTGWLNLPADPLPGDSDMPLIQARSFGASMRLVVSPGREEEGLFEMPGGQSGHPLSPYYDAGHTAWVRGEPGPLLPGATQHTLQLTP